jgi:hypothetical protein
MLGKIAGAILGNKVAGQHAGAKGALLGAGIAAVARRGLGPLGLVLGAGWAAKKLYERRRARQSPPFPGEATPTPRASSLDGNSAVG